MTQQRRAEAPEHLRFDLVTPTAWLGKVVIRIGVQNQGAETVELFAPFRAGPFRTIKVAVGMRGDFMAFVNSGINLLQPRGYIFFRFAKANIGIATTRTWSLVFALITRMQKIYARDKVGELNVVLARKCSRALPHFQRL